MSILASSRQVHSYTSSQDVARHWQAAKRLLLQSMTAPEACNRLACNQRAGVAIVVADESPEPPRGSSRLTGRQQSVQPQESVPSSCSGGIMACSRLTAASAV